MNDGLPPLLLRCSPRMGGNCDTAADAFLRGAGLVSERGESDTHFFGSKSSSGLSLPVADVSLRDHPVLPCLSCGQCSRFLEKPCPLESKDGSSFLLRFLREAPALCFVAPIYFYHVPAHLKALIDRSQSQWAFSESSSASRLREREKRRAWVVLVAAREKGDKLFEGSLLSFKYWLKTFGIDLASPLCLYGLDQPGDLAANTEALDRIRDYASSARGAFTGTGV